MGSKQKTDRLSKFSGKIRPKTPVIRSAEDIVKVTLSHHGVRCQNTFESTGHLQGCDGIERHAATITQLTVPRGRVPTLPAVVFRAVQRLPVCASQGTCGWRERNSGLG